MTILFPVNARCFVNVSAMRTAYDLLQEQAGKIEDPALRRSFLENVTAHREIVALYTRAL